MDREHRPLPRVPAAEQERYEMWMKSPWMRWGAVLGFGLGGFFDGILLHQILQWHHLLSLVPAAGDLRLQVLWDGWFHALMYVIAIVGLWGLWRTRSVGDSVGGRPLLAALLLGFGLWHLVDSVASHWLLGIHRIKLDSPDPLMWDLIWLAAFGLVPLAAGWLLLRRSPPLRPQGGATAAVLVASLVSAGAAGWSLVPPPDQPYSTVVFAPGVEPPQVMSAILAADGRLVWTQPDMGIVIVEVAPERRWSFYRQGALLVSGSGLPAGCFDWSRA